MDADLSDERLSREAVSVLKKLTGADSISGDVKFGDYLQFTNIPKVVRKELTPLDTEDIQKFLTEIRGNPFEILLSVTLFMGLREGEVLALSWHNIDFEHGTVLINCQLQRFREDIQIRVFRIW